jgi:sn-glycerol 3-phosphate transport system permease protein
MMLVSLVTALVIAVGKIAISLLSAFAVVYFRFPLRGLVFWMIFVTLMLPVEVRILPTYKVVSDLGMLNSYAGLTIPLIASATATFLFRQFFLTVPDELVEAARIDGAGPMRFFKDVLLPLSATSIAALFVIQFIYGWNQYLWPLLMTTSEDMYPIVMGIKRMIWPPATRHRMERRDGHRDAGHDPAGAGGHPDAEVVRQGPGRHREITTWVPFP